MVRGLAWDDKPNYLLKVAKILEKKGVSLKVEKDPDRFVELFTDSPTDWDYVVLDLVMQNEFVGDELARRVLSHDQHQVPIFIVTDHARAFFESNDLPPRVIFRSKGIRHGWMAKEIVDVLIARGIYRNPRKIFLIYGHEVEADGINAAIQSYLSEDLKLKVVSLSEREISQGILDGVLDRIRDAVAIVAVCTPDDEVVPVNDPRAQALYPRGNVLIEIGMALALYRGRERLVMLQRWGERIHEQAQLPSNISNELTLRFFGDDLVASEAGPKISEELAGKLRNRLAQLGASFNDD